MSEDPDSDRIGVVLVADDTAVVRRAVQLIFAQEGHRVIEAEDGREALRYAREFSPDLLHLM